MNNSPSPYFSVIVPLYNKVSYIQRCLESIFKQDCTDFEIVLVDDCSTDDGPALAEKLLVSNNFSFQIVNRTHRGGSCAPPRATGCRYARGQLFAFLDADDEWLPGFLTEIKNLVLRFPDAEAFATNRELIVNGQIEPGPYNQKSDIKDAHLIDLKRYIKARKSMGNPFRVQGMAFKPEALDDIGGFVHAPRSSDIDLMFRFFLAGKRAAWSPYCGLRIYRVPDSTMAHTKHQTTRPWFYSVRHALDRQRYSKQVASLLQGDVVRQKTSDMLKAIRSGKLNLSYWNNVFFRKRPVFFLLLFVATLFPSFVQKKAYGIFNILNRVTLFLIR